MTGEGDDSGGRSWGASWFGVGVALAVAATIALVLADDIRYLRLGIVAALWAALVGAFLAARYRKQAVNTEETVAQAQEVYELELEREIAARREYELEIESETRQQVEADSRAELDALRAEIGALRQNLQSLFGGEVLLERLSLTAQATRMRALHEEQRLVESSAGNARPAISAGRKNGLVDRPTELIERVREKQPTRPAGRAASPAPEPRRPERSLDLPPRRVTRSESVSGRGATTAGVAKAAAEAGEQTSVQQPATPPPLGKNVGKKALSAKTPLPVNKPRPTETPLPVNKPRPTDQTRPGMAGSERTRASMRLPVPVLESAEPRIRVDNVLDADRAPAWETQVNREPVPPPGPKPGLPTREVPVANGPGTPRRKPAEPEPIRSPESALSAPVASQAASLFTPNVKETVPLARREPEKPAQSPKVDEPLADSVALVEEARRLAQQQGRSGGHRRRADDESTGDAAAPEGGGRRRANSEPSSWMAPSAADGTRRRAGHSRPELEPVPEPVRTGRRAAAEPSGESGSHSAGRSVSELLAAHGAEAAPPRRRRRAAD